MNKLINYNKIFENKVVFLIIFTLFQPFIDIITGKRFSLLLVVMPLMFINDALKHRISNYKNNTKLIFSTLIIVLILSIINSTDYIGSFMWIYIWIVYYIIYIWGSQYKIDIKLFNINKIIKVYMICSIIISSIGIFQYSYISFFNGWEYFSKYILNTFIGGMLYGRKTAQVISLTGANWFNQLSGFRTTSIFGGPDANGMFSCSILALSFAVKSFNCKRFNCKNKLLNIVIILNLLNLVLSFGRASWLNFIFVVLSLMFFKKNNKKLIMKLLIEFVCIAIIVILFDPSIIDKINIVFKSIFNPDEQSNAGRLNIWSENIDMFLKHPILGWGVGNYNSAYTNTFNVYSQLVSFSAHSAYFLFLIECGGIGLVLFVTLYVKNIIDAKKLYNHAFNDNIKAYSIFLVCSTVGILAQYVFDYDFSNFRFFPIFILNFSILSNIIRCSKKVVNTQL